MDTEEIFLTTRLLIEDFALKIEQPAPNWLDVTLRQRADLIPAVAGLRVKRLGYLACITGLDPGPEQASFEVLYHFCPAAVFINLRVEVPKTDPSIPSLCSIIPSAESFERELQEMFGITVTGLRNPAYLYLPDDWQAGVYPLRKDFDPGQIVNQN
jgi:Ni,Fe-hydrogenase III component G